MGITRICLVLGTQPLHPKSTMATLGIAQDSTVQVVKQPVRRCIASTGHGTCKPGDRCGCCRLCRCCKRCGQCNDCRYEDVSRFIDTAHVLLSTEIGSNLLVGCSLTPDNVICVGY